MHSHESSIIKLQSLINDLTIQSQEEKQSSNSNSNGSNGSSIDCHNQVSNSNALISIDGTNSTASVNVNLTTTGLGIKSLNRKNNDNKKLMPFDFIHNQLCCQTYFKNKNRNTIVCKFRWKNGCQNKNENKNKNKNRKKINHNTGSVLFKPFINHLFIGNKNSKFHQCHKMKIQMKHNDCEHDFYNNGGYWFQCGIICINRKKYNISIKSGNEYKILNTIEKVFKMNEKMEENGCSIGTIMKQNFDNINNSDCFKDLEGYYMKFGHTTHNYNSRYWCEFGKNDKNAYVKLYDSNNNGWFESTYNDNYCLQTGDCVQVCIDNQYLYFLNHNNTIIGQDINEKEFKNGKIKLDFENYCYLYAISSMRCTCKDRSVIGFHFEVTV